MIPLYSDEVIFRMQRAGGVSVYCAELLSRAIDDPGVDVSLLHAHGMPAIDNIAYRARGLACAQHVGERPGSLLAQRISRADLRGRDGSPAIFHGTYLRTAVGPGMRNVLTVHDFTHQRYFPARRRLPNTLLKRRCISAADAIICVSESTRRDLLYFVPEAAGKRVEVVMNGVSDAYRPLDTSPLDGPFALPAPLSGRPFLLYVGSRVAYKNFSLCAPVLVALGGVSLAVVGGPPLSDAELALFGDAADRVFHFAGLADDELNVLYNNAVALLYPSFYEGFGIPVVEAMRAGCPVIAFDNSSIPEVAGSAGILLEDGDVDCAVRAVRRLAGDDAFREERIAAGLDHAARFSWDTAWQQTRALYEELLDIS